ncbi:MAG TPA: DUF5317 domain-containing protein [Candidatus Limnocylindrales bacterium]|nr:DUF5317 domain-containing protein [Candidatus Limnocylindrales bacterium]
MLLLYAIPIGLLIGLAAGGRLGLLGQVRIRWWPLAIGGLLFQLVLFSRPVASVVGEAGPALYVGSTLVVLVALLANLGQPGFRLIFAGALLNMLVVGLNGGQMPASPEALQAVFGTPNVPVDHFSNSVVAGPGTALAFLGDIFVLPPPFPAANVFSIGDVLIGAGGVWFIVRTMRGADQPASPIAAGSTAPSASSLRA